MNDDWDYGDYDLIIKQAQRDLAACRAENQRLREALKQIQTLETGTDRDDGDCLWCDERDRIARAALS